MESVTCRKALIYSTSLQFLTNLYVCVYATQSMVDISADEGWLSTTLRVMHLVQMCVQGRWLSDASALILPHFTAARLNSLKQSVLRSSVARKCNIEDCSSLPEILVLYQQDVNFMQSAILKAVQTESQAKEVCNHRW